MIKAMSSQSLSTDEYWNSHTVADIDEFNNRSESLDYFHWRCDQYPGYLELMPVDEFDGLDILDYGCGPGHDLVGFLEFSKPKSVLGIDISERALSIARRRLELHSSNFELKKIRTGGLIDLENESIDYIHSSGVLHHTDPTKPLAEFHRVLRSDGRIRIMIYNYDSIFYHLYVPFKLQIVEKVIPESLDARQAFQMSTDGPFCPRADAYSFEEFQKICLSLNFECRLVGAAPSTLELELANSLLERAKSESRLDQEHRTFLNEVVFKDGIPHFGLVPAGIDLVVELRKARDSYS
jgi:SAM-dependent methyltransferase